MTSSAPSLPPSTLRNSPQYAAFTIERATGWATNTRNDGPLGHTIFISHPGDRGALLAIATIYPSGRFSVSGGWSDRVRRALLVAGFQQLDSNALFQPRKVR